MNMSHVVIGVLVWPLIMFALLFAVVALVLA